MWVHKDYTSGKNGVHTPIRLVTFLPEPEASQFSQAVVATPDLLEEVFQGMFPRLTAKGLQRVQTNKVIPITAPESVLDETGRMQFAKTQLPLCKPITYSNIIGEQPK
ncbi:hypothetical protein HY357_02445 [Candidatus Roizmanbacteria bacterium]|nr:hypothetical protein [Candidatus Roizmanbacteria bacterium]